MRGVVDNSAFFLCKQAQRKSDNNKKQQEANMLTKRFFKKKCRVRFELPRELSATTAYLVGDFNNWDKTATPMKQLKSGVWKIDVDLQKNREYQFRYFLDGSEWHNDWNADAYVPNNVDGDNSVVSTYEPTDK